MKYVFLFCFFYLSVSVRAQLVDKEEVIIKSVLTGEDIKGIAYKLGERVEDFYIDTLLQAALVQLRGLSKRKKKPVDSGTLLYLDLKSDTVAWTKKMSYEEDKIKHFPGVIIKEKIYKDRTFLIDHKTGIVSKEIAQDIFYVSPSNNLGIGYDKRAVVDPSILHGVDLNTNTVLWKERVDRKFGVSECVHLSDSVLLLSASGLHSINIENGDGWSMEAVTGEQVSDINQLSFLSIGLGLNIPIGFGVIGVMIAIPIGGNSDDPDNMITKIRGVESNILLDGDYIYYASRYQIFKLDKEGNVIWSTLREDELSSHASLALKGDLLYMVNSGTAFSTRKTVRYGKAGFFAFDAETGEKIIRFPFNTFTDEVISDSKIRDDQVVVIAKNKLLKITKDKQLKSYDFPILKREKFIGFLDNNNFTAHGDGLFTKTTDYYPGDYHLITNKNTIYRLDKNLDEQEVKLVENIWNQIAAFGSLKILSDNKTALIINGNGQKIATLNTDSVFTVKGGKLYFTQGSKLTVLDLSLLE